MEVKTHEVLPRQRASWGGAPGMKSTIAARADGRVKPWTARSHPAAPTL